MDMIAKVWERMVSLPLMKKQACSAPIVNPAPETTATNTDVVAVKDDEDMGEDLHEQNPQVDIAFPPAKRAKVEAESTRRPPLRERSVSTVAALNDSIVQPRLDPIGAVLVNALSFKGEWNMKFDASLTGNQLNFFDGFGRQLTCPIMIAEGVKRKFECLETDKYQMACLPYGNAGEYPALTVLPRADASPTLSMGCDRVAGAACKPRPATMLADLTAEWKDEFHCKQGTVQFPHFKVESELQLGPLLAPRGIHLAFGNDSDFGAMLNEASFTDKVVLKTFIEINEEGTEATATTSILGMLSSRFLKPEPEFTMV
jgi:serine protease inhibitor